MNPRNAATLFALAAFAITESALAQLADPTRPPNLSGLPFGTELAVPSGPVLQSIVLSPVRRLALIDGKLIGIGDRVGAATLVGIDFDSVRLREGGGTKVVKLLPEVQKRDKDMESRSVNTNPNPMGDVQ